MTAKLEQRLLRRGAADIVLQCPDEVRNRFNAPGFSEFLYRLLVGRQRAELPDENLDVGLFIVFQDIASPDWTRESNDDGLPFEA